MMIHRGIDRISLGDFVQKVVILKPQQTRNGRGAIEQTWVELATVYGKLTVTPADEVMVDQNIVNQDRFEFTTYVRCDITSEYRLKIEGILYGITSVSRLQNQPLMVIKGEKITER